MTALSSRIRLAIARLPFRNAAPDGPATICGDPWQGDAEQGTRFVARFFRFDRKDYDLTYGRVPITAWPVGTWPDPVRRWLFGFSWLRDLRALGGDDARLTARKLVEAWVVNPPGGLAEEDACTTGTRIASWLANHAFCLASADRRLQKKLMERIVVEARTISALFPLSPCGWSELSALRGLLAAALAVPGQSGFMVRFLRYLPTTLEHLLLPDGTVIERSPQAQLNLVQELVEMSLMFRAAHLRVPPVIEAALEKACPVLRALCHADGRLAVFNGSSEGCSQAIERALAQGSRLKLLAPALPDGKFARISLGKSLLIVDAGVPAPNGADRMAHAGTLSFEFSNHRHRIFVNCGAASLPPWCDALRASPAHNVLIPDGRSSSDFDGRGRVTRRPVHVACGHQSNGEAHWLDLSHDGYYPPLGATWRRQIYLGGNGEDLRGQDEWHGERAVSLVLRFHIHPDVQVTQEDEDVILRAGERLWRFRQRGATLSVEPDVYLGRSEIEPTRQIVLSVEASSGSVEEEASARAPEETRDGATPASPPPGTLRGTKPPLKKQMVSWLLERIPE